MQNHLVGRVCVCETDFLGQDQWLLHMCLRILAQLARTLVNLPR